MERAVYGKPSRRQSGERIGVRADERVAGVLEMSHEDLLSQAPDNMIIGLDAISAARLSKRFGMCKLRVTLNPDAQLGGGG